MFLLAFIIFDAARPPRKTQPIQHCPKKYLEHEMLKMEDEFLWVKPDGIPTVRAGIALSGGGIRAASFALGVLQQLAISKQLSNFHYLSTVSGGGYIGSALSYFWRGKTKDRFNADDDFPFQDSSLASDLPSANKEFAKNLTFLHNNCSYLTSSPGITFASIIIAVFRTIVLSLIVWLPLLIAVFVLIEFLNVCAKDNLFLPDGLIPEAFTEHQVYLIPLVIAAIQLLFFLAGLLLMPLFAWLNKGASKPSLPLTISVAIIFVMLAFVTARYFGEFTTIRWAIAFVFSVVAISLISQLFIRNPTYFMRGLFDQWGGGAFPVIFVAASFLASLPIVSAPLVTLLHSTDIYAELKKIFGILGALAALVSGIGSALHANYSKSNSTSHGLAGRIFPPTGALLFFCFLLIFCYIVGHEIHEAGNPQYIIWWVPLGVALLIGVFGDINVLGLHRFYRDRLMETFMRNTDADYPKRTDDAENLSIHKLFVKDRERRLPYHLINTNLILRDKKTSKIGKRGGDNFLISPLHIGSDTTGWMNTKDYVEQRQPLTLATAMAVSGAAINNNAGSNGKGITRNSLVSAVMTFLNIRLGLWIRNPNNRPCFGFTPTYFGLTFRLALASMFRRYHDQDAAFLELSDGGHFENLGLYELIRRRIDLIVVVDAEEDKPIALSGLVSSLNRIEEDFGAIVEFPSRAPDRLVGQPYNYCYPSGVTVADSPFMEGTITYSRKSGNPDEIAKTGKLIYIKSTMLRDHLDIKTLGYRAAHPDFPHEPTVNQFFTPDQFEAYRDLGKKSCELMIEYSSLKHYFPQPLQDDLISGFQAGA